MATAAIDPCFKILNDSYHRALKQENKAFVTNAKIFKRIETVTLCLRNRAGIRALLSCALAKIHNPKLDIRKPYTDISGDDGSTSYSGRLYDEKYIEGLKSKPYLLPINSTTPS